MWGLPVNYTNTYSYLCNYIQIYTHRFSVYTDTQYKTLQCHSFYFHVGFNHYFQYKFTPDPSWRNGSHVVMTADKIMHIKDNYGFNVKVSTECYEKLLLKMYWLRNMKISHWSNYFSKL